MWATTVKGPPRWLAVCAIALAVGGCGEKGGATGSSAPATSSAAPEPEYSDEANAFMLGRLWAFACVYTIKNKPAEVSKAMIPARAIGNKLGVTILTPPEAADALKEMRSKAISDALTAKKGEKVANLFRLGVVLTDGWYGASLQGNLTRSIAEIEYFAKAAGAPESIWKTQLDAAKPTPNARQLLQIAEDLEEHYQK